MQLINVYNDIVRLIETHFSLTNNNIIITYENF